MPNTLLFSDFFENCRAHFPCRWIVSPNRAQVTLPDKALPWLGYVNPLSPPAIAIVTAPEHYALCCPQQTTLAVLTKQIDPVFITPHACVPLLEASLHASQLFTFLYPLLQKTFQTKEYVHGVMMDCFGKGVLILGPPGVGKSQTALQLLARHHRLIADDNVICYQKTPFQINAYADPRLDNLLEVRGIGVIDVRQWYGPCATVAEKAIDIVITLDSTLNDPRPLKRELEKKIILGVSLPHIRLPLAFKYDLAMLIESAIKFAFSPTSTKVDSLLSLA